jgi:hypothetical protein
MAIVYRHRRLDNNKIFYIGISNGYDRPYQSGNKRNDIWNSIIKKTDYIVEIICENLSYEDSLELEILLIKEYGRISEKTGSLANLTDGGEGKLGCKPWNAGTKGIKESNSGSFVKGCKAWNKGIPILEKQKKIISSIHKGKKISKEHIDKLSKIRRKLCLDINTGIFYDSLKEACLALNLNCNSESIRIKRKSKFQRIIYV